VADDHIAGEIGNEARRELRVALHADVAGRLRTAESGQSGGDEADRCVADRRLREEVVVKSRRGERSREQEDCVIGALRPGVAQHPAEMLAVRLDHAAVKVGMAWSLSVVFGDAKSFPDS
jgi:hypothetical protein